MAVNDQLQTEQAHHKSAFELYYSLGAGRSYKRVANKVGVSPSTVKLWSRSFDWRQRIRERDANVARQAADQAMQANVNEQSRNLKIVRVALLKVAKAIAGGHVRVQIGDLDRLIRLEEHLTGSDDFDREEIEWYRQFEWIRKETDPEKLKAIIRKSCEKYCPFRDDKLPGDAQVKGQ